MRKSKPDIPEGEVIEMFGNGINMGSVLLSADYNIQYFNSSASALMLELYNVHLALDENLLALLPPSDQQKLMQLAEESLQEASVKRIYTTEDQGNRYKALEIVCIANSIYNAKGFLLLGKDVTDLKRSENALHNWQQFFLNNPLPMYLIDSADYRFLAVNNAALAMYGYSEEKFLQLKATEIRPGNEMEGFRNAVKECAETNTIHQGIYTQNNIHGELQTVSVTAFPQQLENRRVLMVQIVNITENLLLRQQVQKLEVQEKSELTRAIVLAREEQRIEIGNELHDNVNQILSTVKLYVNMVLNDPGLQNELLPRAERFVLMAIEELRKVSKELAPPNIGENGLLFALHDLVESVRITGQFNIQLLVETFDESLINGELKLAVYRIVQEQLNNIIKHSKANVVRIQLNTEQGNIRLDINDNGSGFNVKTVRKGSGINNIMNRAAMHNGLANLSSLPGQGTDLHISFPLKES